MPPSFLVLLASIVLINLKVRLTETIPERCSKDKNIFLSSGFLPIWFGCFRSSQIGKNPQPDMESKTRLRSQTESVFRYQIRRLNQMAVRPKIKPPLLASAKIPDTKIRKIIEGYAYCVPAADTAQAVDVSYLTARTIYGLIRRRMIELGFYLTPSQYEAMKEEDEGESYWDPAPYRAFVRQHVGRRRGVTPSTLEEHSAELIFWYEKPPHQTERQFARQHHVDVLQLLKLTAPFNRPLTAAADQAAYLYRAKRTLRWGEERLSLILQSPEIEKTIDRVELRASFHFRQKRRFGR